MKESSPYSVETSSTAGDSYVKHICRLFRAARAAGRQPRIEDYVTELGEPERSTLLRELLACELSERGPEISTSDDYRARFPEHRSLIESLFDAWASQRKPPEQKPETIRALEQTGEFEGDGSSFQEPRAHPRRRQGDASRHASLSASESRRPSKGLSVWTSIRLLARPRNRRAAEGQKIPGVTRRYRLRLAALLCLLALLGCGVLEVVGRLRAGALIRALATAETVEVPKLLEDAGPYRRWANPLLRTMAAEAAPGSKECLHAALALAASDRAQADYLADRLLTASPDEVTVIRDALQAHGAELAERYWAVVQDSRSDSGRRLRAACALATLDPDAAGWSAAGNALVQALAGENLLVMSKWADALRPVRNRLIAPLAAVFRNKQRPESERMLAANLLADYAAGRAEVLADLVSDADPKQYALLFPILKNSEQGAAGLLSAELATVLKADWKDAPLEQAWPAPHPALVHELETADGLVAERFALCQTLPGERFDAVAEALGRSGYRPVCFRPYSAGKKEQVAAAWTRDGREWKAAHGLTARQVRAQDTTLRAQGFWPLDVAGYLASEGNSQLVERYAALWSRPDPAAEDARLYVGLAPTLEDLQAACEPLANSGYLARTLPSFDGVGERRYSGVWIKPRLPSAGAPHLLEKDELSYEAGLTPGKLLADVRLVRPARAESSRERYTKQLAQAQQELDSRPGDLNARLQRAIAWYRLGDYEKALLDLDVLAERTTSLLVTGGRDYRALVHARLGPAEEARRDLNDLQRRNYSPSQYAFLDATVAVYLGNDAEGLKRLDEAVAARPRDANFPYDAARAYALASAAVISRQPERGKAYAARALALLQAAVVNGFEDYRRMQTDDDLEVLHGWTEFQALLRPGGLDRQYSACWAIAPALASEESHGLDPSQHNQRCRQLAAAGWRPVSLSVEPLGEKESLVTASVWHRPALEEDAKERLAKRQANAAVALLGLGEAEQVWSLFRQQPDPRLRSYLIHRLAMLRIDARVISNRLADEPDVSAKRALLLALGEFTQEQLPPSEREAMVPSLLRLYREHPDSGLHGAVDWLLRKWGKEDETRMIDKALARRDPEETGRAAQTRTSAPWYVNSQGQTFTVITGPVEFLMGSPLSEADRPIGPGGKDPEPQHRQRIGRSFAIASREVTVEQFRRFRPGQTVNRNYAVTRDSPACGVTWYLAAEYCNWLSKQEGIPEDQWCYVPNAQGLFAEGMRTRPGHLNLSGYRLPTSAEWEFAGRSGTLTARYYGETDELLPQYAWHAPDSRGGRTIPAGSLKPNDFGLFDTLGNVDKWCDSNPASCPSKPGKVLDDEESIEDATYITDSQHRLLFGGSFGEKSGLLRSASRQECSPLSDSSNLGFRPARTVR